MKITDLINEEAIQINGIAKNKEDAIKKMIDLMMKNKNIKNKEEYTKIVMQKITPVIHRQWLSVHH